MKIFTTYFAKLKKIDPEILPIAICAKVPDWFDGPVLSELAPTKSILYQFKETGDEGLYIERFNDEVLSLISPESVYNLIVSIAEANSVDQVALVCYEKSDTFCHRHLVADWLNQALGLTIEEL